MKTVLGLLIMLLLVLGVPVMAFDVSDFPGKGKRADFDRALDIARQGLQLRKQKKTKEAIALYEKSIAIYPYNAGIYFNMGYALSELGENAKAVAAFRKAIAIAPDYDKPYTSLVPELAALNDWKGAEQAARTACRLAPNDAAAHMNLGEVLLQTKRLPEAAKVIDAALKMPNVAEYREELQKMKVRAKG